MRVGLLGRLATNFAVGLAFAAGLVLGAGSAQAQQTPGTWTCAFEGHRMNRPGGQWLPNGRVFSRSGSNYLSVRRAAFEECQADAARDGIDTARVVNACVMTTCADNGSPRREAPHTEATPQPSVSGRNVPAGQEYCEFKGGLWVPTRSGTRHFIENGRVYSSQKDSFAHQAAWDACIKGEPIGNNGCVNAGCKRGPAAPTNPTGPTNPVGPTGLPSGNFEYYWRQVNGNWASAPVRTATQGCPHPGTNACDAPYRKTYLAGEGTTYFRNGCNAAPIQIACVVQKAGYTPPQPQPKGPTQPQLNPFCQNYADATIAANQQGQQRKCPAFAKANMSWQAHYDWCTKQTASGRVNDARTERDKLLKSCQAGPVTPVTGRPTGKYQPGERIISRVGEWDLREHIRPNGSFERCTITMEKYKPVVWRVMSMDDGRYLLSVPKPAELPEGTRKKFRYGVNRKWFDGEFHITGGRTVVNITNTINEFGVTSDVDIPTGRSTYRVFFYSMPQAMNALKSCRQRFR